MTDTMVGESVLAVLLLGEVPSVRTAGFTGPGGGGGVGR